MDFILYEWPNGVRTACITPDATVVDVYDRNFTPSGVSKTLIGRYDVTTKQMALTGQYTGVEYITMQIEQCLQIAKSFITGAGI